MIKRVCKLLAGLSLAVGVAQASPYIEQVQAVVLDTQQRQSAEEQLLQRWPVLEQQPAVVPPFHQRVAAVEPARGTLCGNCHSTAPHRRDQARRAFLNGHTARMDCMVCHWRPEGEAQNKMLEYRWFSLTDLTVLAVDQLPELSSENQIKIAVLDDQQPVTVSSRHPFAEQAEKQWQAEEGRVELHARLHVPLKTEGPACSDCHQSRAPLLDLKSLGYSEERQQALVQHPIPRFIDRLQAEQQSRIQLTDLLRR